MRLLVLWCRDELFVAQVGGSGTGGYDDEAVAGSGAGYIELLRGEAGFCIVFGLGDICQNDGKAL